MVSQAVSPQPEPLRIEFEPSTPLPSSWPDGADAPDGGLSDSASPGNSPIDTEANRATYQAHAGEVTNFATAVVGGPDEDE